MRRSSSPAVMGFFRQYAGRLPFKYASGWILIDKLYNPNGCWESCCWSRSRKSWRNKEQQAFIFYRCQIDLEASCRSLKGWCASSWWGVLVDNDGCGSRSRCIWTQAFDGTQHKSGRQSWWSELWKIIWDRNATEIHQTPYLMAWDSFSNRRRIQDQIQERKETRWFWINWMSSNMSKSTNDYVNVARPFEE